MSTTDPHSTPAQRVPATRSSAVLLVAFSLGGLALASAILNRDARPRDLDARWRINPNIASLAELELLPGIGPTLAANIIEYRESAPQRPAFKQPSDLDAVSRIGPVIIERLGAFLTFDEPGAPADRP